MHIKVFILSIIFMILTAAGVAAAEPVTAKIPVSCKAGDKSAEYTYRIEATEKDAPLPAKDSLTLKDSQKGEFEISYDMPGSWHYQILQTKPEAAENDESSKPYTAAVFVGSKEDGSLFLECTYYRTGSTFKSEECAFTYAETPPATGSAVMEKVDVGNKMKLLPGATLQLFDPEGNEVTHWISDNKAKQLTGLQLDTEYRIHELTIPKGYEIEPNGDLTFQISKDGKVTITNDTGDQKKDGTIQILNGPMGVNWEEKYPKRYKGLLGADKDKEEETDKKGQKGAGRTKDTDKSTGKDSDGTLASVRTADETMLLPWLIMMVLSLVCIAVAVRRIRIRR